MQTAKQGDTVLINYTVRTNDGRIVGGTEENEPHSLTIGGSEIFPEIETALDGMQVGSAQDITVTSDNAFGPRRDEMVMDIPRAQLPEGEPPQPGMTLSAQQPDGTTMNLAITAVGEDAVTVDGNHPLAGEDLQFAVTLVEIAQAA